MKFSTNNLIATAKIHGTFGLDGFVKIESFSGDWEHFADISDVFLEFRAPNTLDNGWYVLSEVKMRSADALLRIKGFENENEAKKLKDACIYIPRSKAPHLNDGEFYANDLCNCVLVCGGKTIGKITSIVEGGSSLLLELSEAASGRTILIPFNNVFIGEIDLEGKTVELMHRWILE